MRCALWTFGSRHAHVAIQTNAELTGSLSIETALALARAADMVSHRSRVILEMSDMLY